MKKTFKTISLILLILLVLVGLVGCTKEEETLVNGKSYPFEYTDGYGDVTTIERKPQRIVSVSPNITEILCSLGLEDKIVGRTDYCDYPESVESISTIGDILNPSIEKIVELEPDLVLSEGMQSSRDFATNLRNLGIPVICIRSNSSLEGTYKSIQDIGLITGRSNEAEKIVQDMKKDLEEIARLLKNIDKKSVFYVIGFGEYGLSTATGDTYVNELLEKAGLNNIAKDGTNWSYSVEKLYEHNPDIIICSKYYDAKTGIKQDDILKDLVAVKEGKIIEIDNNQLDRQTARNIDGIKELVRSIYELDV